MSQFLFQFTTLKWIKASIVLLLNNLFNQNDTLFHLAWGGEPPAKEFSPQLGVGTSKWIYERLFIQILEINILRLTNILIGIILWKLVVILFIPRHIFQNAKVTSNKMEQKKTGPVIFSFSRVSFIWGHSFRSLLAQWQQFDFFLRDISNFEQWTTTLHFKFWIPEVTLT